MLYVRNSIIILKNFRFLNNAIVLSVSLTGGDYDWTFYINDAEHIFKFFLLLFYYCIFFIFSEATVMLGAFQWRGCISLLICRKQVKTVVKMHLLKKNVHQFYSWNLLSNISWYSKIIWAHNQNIFLFSKIM